MTPIRRQAHSILRPLCFIVLSAVVLCGYVYGQENIPDGPKTTYFPDGQIKAEVIYKDGKLDGPAKKYYETGALYQEAFFNEGTPEGIGKIFYPNGQIEVENTYHNGEIVATKKYDDQGNVIEDTTPKTEAQEIAVPLPPNEASKAQAPESLVEPAKKPAHVELLELKGTPAPQIKSKPVVSPYQIRMFRKELSADKLSKRIEKTSFLTLFLISFIALLLYVVICMPLHIIANKLQMTNAGMAFIPIANLLLMCQIANRPKWWLLLALIPFAGGLIFLIIIMILWIDIAKARKKPLWLGILTIIPIIGFFIPWYIALSEKDYSVPTFDGKL